MNLAKRIRNSKPLDVYSRVAVFYCDTYQILIIPRRSFDEPQSSGVVSRANYLGY